MREEIIAGLKNAMAHGSSLEEAVQSFINAGYNYNEVNEAANTLSATFSSQPSLPILPQNSSQMPAQASLPIQTLEQSLPATNYQITNSGRNSWLIVAIIVSLLIFLGSISYLVYILLSTIMLIGSLKTKLSY